MKIFSFIVYILFISVFIIFTLPQQTRFRDKVTRRIYEQGFFVQYKKCIFFYKTSHLEFISNKLFIF